MHTANDWSVTLDGQRYSTAAFLTACARSLASEPRSDESRIIDVARDALLRSGLSAVEELSNRSWIHVGITIDVGQTPEIYGALLNLAADLLGSSKVQNFFYMHKKPGLRIRFEPVPSCRFAIERLLQTHLATLMSARVIDSAVPGVYEPESHLFGGAASMRIVHNLFTADSLAWLGYHELVAAGTRPGPDWAFALALFRSLIEALAIEGWEQRDVFDRVREQCGRRLAESDFEMPGFDEITREIRRMWYDISVLHRCLSESAVALIEEFAAAARPEAKRWYNEYFNTGCAYVGPRAAAAHYAVFLWNRGRLSTASQSLLTESLASDMSTGG